MQYNFDYKYVLQYINVPRSMLDQYFCVDVVDVCMASEIPVCEKNWFCKSTLNAEGPN